VGVIDGVPAIVGDTLLSVVLGVPPAEAGVAGAMLDLGLVISCR
jgi:hypothetical protein